MVTRKTNIHIDTAALLHNLRKINLKAPHSGVIAMVKANAYGCGLANVIPVLDGEVSYFGVACLEEAAKIRALGAKTPCLLVQGVFEVSEYAELADKDIECVIHQAHQLEWLLQSPLSKPLKIWVKINTGMQRLGFSLSAVPTIIKKLQACPWVAEHIGIMTHFASADEPTNPSNQAQLAQFALLDLPEGSYSKSLANSAAIMTLPEAQADYVRPGIMLYGVSPFRQKTGLDLDLKPVMQFTSIISALHDYDAGLPVGYGGTWTTERPSRIGVVAVGYGDGYPWHLTQPTYVFVNGVKARVVGRVSMDMMTIDLTDAPPCEIGAVVELWGKNIPIETVALSAETIPYELMCQFSPRPR